MSLDRSLKSASSLVRHRNVLTRAERLDRLADEEKWDDSKSVFNLPKVGNRKMALAKAEKAEVAAPQGEATGHGGREGRAADIELAAHLGVEAAAAHEHRLRRIDIERQAYAIGRRRIGRGLADRSRRRRLGRGCRGAHPDRSCRRVW